MLIMKLIKEINAINLIGNIIYLFKLTNNRGYSYQIGHDKTKRFYIGMDKPTDKQIIEDII